MFNLLNEKMYIIDKSLVFPCDSETNYSEVQENHIASLLFYYVKVLFFM